MKLTFTLLFIGISVSCIAQTDMQTNTHTTDKHAVEFCASLMIRTNDSTNSISQHIASINLQYMYQVNERSAIGIGTGLEYFNRGQNIEITQIPFYVQISKRLIKEASLCIDFKPGFILPIKGNYYDNLNKAVNYNHEDFFYAPYYEFGLSVKLGQRVKLRAMVRNQSTGVIYPTEERRSVFGIQLIFN